MPTTRRDLLNALACGTGAGALSALLPVPARGRDETEAVTARIRADLERHASFGYKFSGGPGDLATANWIAGRLRRSGYRVEESQFPAPFFIERTARLTADAASVPVVPQAPVVTTGPGGVTAPLALVEKEVGDVRGRIALIVTPFGRPAALFATRGIWNASKRSSSHRCCARTKRPSSGSSRTDRGRSTDWAALFTNIRVRAARAGACV